MLAADADWEPSAGDCTSSEARDSGAGRDGGTGGCRFPCPSFISRIASSAALRGMSSCSLMDHSSDQASVKQGSLVSGLRTMKFKVSNRITRPCESRLFINERRGKVRVSFV